MHVNGSSFKGELTVTVNCPGGSSTLNGSGLIKNVTSTGFDMVILLGAAGSWSIRVNNPGGTQSNTFAFTVR